MRGRARWPIFGLLLLAWCQGLREDELECEEAAVRLEECCNPWPGSIECSYREGCNQRRYPLSTRQSRCLQKMSCDEIVAQNICGRNLHGPYEDYYYGEGGLTAETTVCP